MERGRERGIVEGGRTRKTRDPPTRPPIMACEFPPTEDKVGEAWDSVEANRRAFARNGARARTERAAALVAVFEASILNCVAENGRRV